MNIFDLSGSTRTLIAAVIAFSPAIFRYVRGRQVARFADDPALPERLFAGGHVTSGSLAFAIAFLIMFAGTAAIWAIPVAVIAYVAAGLPLRRLLYNETWSLGFYLSIVIRFFIAGWSFWALVGALPALALWTGGRAWMVSLVMGVCLIIFSDRQTDLIRWLIGARAIADRAIRARFDRLVAASGLPAPHFELVDLRGGSFANAFALPSLGRSAVVFTGPLLERLDADEIDAICAHELAHLEYHNRRRLRHRRFVSRTLVVAGTLLTPALQQLFPSAAWLVCATWPAVVLMTIVWLVHDQQKHETASDLRAVALTGDPEALVRGLVKLHAIARVPRRWDADLERHMSHPSLKRRIQDIRAAAGTPPAALGDAAVFESPDRAARVVFRDENLEWIEGASASYRARYEHLSELRIAATQTGDISLVLADRNGHKWQMPVHNDDVARIQAVLDIVDTRTGGRVTDTSLQPLLIRAATFTVLIVSLNAGLFAVAMVLAMALARPETPLLCAAGLAAVVGALLASRDPGPIYSLFPEPVATTFAFALLAGGALLVWLAYIRRRDEVSMQGWKLAGVVAILALASWLMPVMGSGMDAVGLHQAAREWPSSIVLPLALAGAMMWSTRKTLRAASAAAVIASAVAYGVASQAFLERFGHDLFLQPTRDVTVRTLETPIKEFTLPFAVSDVQLSPGGRSIAAITQQQGNRTTVHIGRAGETLSAIAADGALFMDDDRALVWAVDGTRTDLREVIVGASEAPGWQLRVSGVSTPAISVDPTSKRWRLASRAGVEVMEAREGVVGTEQIDSYRWSVATGRASPLMPIALSGDRALALEPRFDLALPVTDPLGTFMFVLASTPRWRSTLWSLGPEGARGLGTSRLELACQSLTLGGRGGCHVFDASRTRFFAMDAATGRMTAVTSLPGRFFAGDDPQREWMTGWYQSRLVAVRLGPVDAIRLGGPDGAHAHMLAVSDRAAAGVWYQIPAASATRVEPLYQAAGTSVIRIYSLD